MAFDTMNRIGHIKENSEGAIRILCNEFVDEAKMVIKREILLRMSEVFSPELTSRLTRSLIGYARIANCIEATERIALTRFCLTTLHIKAPGDCNAVVEILINFRCPSRIYVQEFYSQYTVPMTRFIFESCIRARFNFRNFILDHPANSAPGVNPVCFILENLLQGNYRFLRLFMEFGFERSPPKNPASMRYEFLRIAQSLTRREIEIPEMLNDASDEDMQKYKLVLETAFFVCASLNEYDNRQWDAIARLIWRSIPDPCLTVSDVISFIAAGADEEKVARITARCHSDRFREIFRDVPQPRCLKHLCRCVIRGIIGRNFLLPLGIYELELPTTLADYLDI